MKKKIIRYDRIVILIIFIITLISFGILLFNSKTEVEMPDFTNRKLSEINDFASKYKLELEINKENNDSIEKDRLFNQNIKPGEKVKINKDKISIYLSLGPIDVSVYIEKKVDESGRVPVMMYHGIQNISDSETENIGGNIDKDGYHRTAESFRRDLEFYYNSGYRMIRLIDYVNGKIDVEIGFSPIVLTFDDGLKNNINVIGLDNNGNIIIDPNSAIGILEEFKKKYPGFNVTATFFLNSGLFHQPNYDKQILKWLIENGYDIGNHSYNHADFSSTNIETTQKEICLMYQKLNDVIGNKFVNIVALPFGSPYTKEHINFNYILNCHYDNANYKTTSTLRVGWESNYSPFSKSFDPEFIKRIRAYDNNGIDFDIETNFKMLEKIKYISDGDINKIVVPIDSLELINDKSNFKIITYERER